MFGQNSFELTTSSLRNKKYLLSEMCLKVTLILAAATLAAAAPFTPIEEIHKPLPYTFGYKIKDKHGEQHRAETGDGVGAVKGSYGFTDERGIHRQVHYVADKAGFRAEVKTNEHGTAPQDPAHVKMISSAHPYLGGVGAKILGGPALAGLEAAKFLGGPALTGLESAKFLGGPALAGLEAAKFLGGPALAGLESAKFLGGPALAGLEAAKFLGDPALAGLGAAKFLGGSALASLEAAKFHGGPSFVGLEAAKYHDAALAAESPALFGGPLFASLEEPKLISVDLGTKPAFLGAPLAVRGLPLERSGVYAEPLFGGAITGYDSRFVA